RSSVAKRTDAEVETAQQARTERVATLRVRAEHRVATRAWRVMGKTRNRSRSRSRAAAVMEPRTSRPASEGSAPSTRSIFDDEDRSSSPPVEERAAKADMAGMAEAERRAEEEAMPRAT